MMMMGSVALAACLIPLIAIGVLVVAFIQALTGGSSELLERLLPPGVPIVRAVTDPPRQRVREQRVDYAPIGARQMFRPVSKISGIKIPNRFYLLDWQFL
jgi:hypothetical protein